MDDSSKAVAKSMKWSNLDTESDDLDSGLDQEIPATPQQPDAKQESTDEKASDRWFHEQRGGKRVPKRLEIPNEVLVTTGGPLRMTGNITLIDEDGHANYLTLCRCGASKNKPLCDDKHLDIEFFDSGSVQRLSEWMPLNRPQNLTVSCVKDGPLKYRGYLRVYNKKGQECITMSGSLCRCGKSAKKPFCDGAFGCSGA